MDTEGILDEIKSRLEIAELVSEHVPLKRAGRNLKGLCPFHAEKTPSFMVNPERQVFHCFGCGAGGDIFEFIMRHDNLQFSEALEVLAKRAGVELRRQGPGQRGERERIKAALAEALEFWRQGLEKSEDAREYLRKRGLSAASIEGFSLGYAPRGWQTLLGYLKGKGFKEDKILKAGLAAQGDRGPYDVFRSRIIFPIADIHGDPIAFGGRVMDESMPKYLNSPETMLFKKGETLYALNAARDGIRGEGEAVVVEGYMDVIMCHQNGLSNVVAPLGTALTPGHLRKLSTLTGNVILLFDGDPAGIAAAKRSMALILEHGLRGRVLALPTGEDPDSVLRTSGPEHLKALLAKAGSPVEFLLSTSAGRKTETLREAIALIAKAGEPILRDELILELSERTGTRELTIREQLKRFVKTGAFSPAATKGGGNGVSYNEEVLLLSAALSSPEKTREIFGRIGLDDIRDVRVREVFGRLLRDGPTSARPLPEEALSAEGRTLVSMLSVNAGFDPSEVERNISDCIKRIDRRRLDEKIKTAEVEGDLKLLNNLYSERQRLIQRGPDEEI